MEEIFYSEISSDRDISTTAFSKGEINYHFNLDNRCYVNFGKSYIKTRIRFTKNDGTAITSSTIAPNMFLFNNLFQSQKLMLDNVVISEVGDYVSQISSLKNRMYKSEDYLNTYGKYTDFSDVNVETRNTTLKDRNIQENLM